MQYRSPTLINLVSMLIICCTVNEVHGVDNTINRESPAAWYQSGEQAVSRNMAAMQQALQNITTPAKNIILFVGDGMGVSTITAARIYAGQRKGATGEENFLSFERFPYTALAKTYNTNQQTPDSAGTMTAIMTGVKTKAGLISVNQNVIRGNCPSVTGNQLTTALELAEMAGMATGVVTTARITHATPAATYAHSMDRNFESDADASNFTLSKTCQDIASQLINLPRRFAKTQPWVDGLEVALGGGRKHFLPSNATSAATRGTRQDQRNLIDAWLHNYTNAAYVENKQQLNNVNPQSTAHLLGLFSPSHMAYDIDRREQHLNEPSLSDMTAAAIRLLQKNPNGFFLHVEAGRIDHAHHATNPRRALADTVELANAVEVALRNTDPQETLIIVTADHSHVFTLAGYPTRGNPILGKVISNNARGEAETTPLLAADGKSFTTVGYLNGPGWHPLNDSKSEPAHSPSATVRRDLSTVDTSDINFRPDTLVPLPSETHGAEDVAIYATGPGAALVNGVLEQHVIFHIMNRAAKLRERAAAGPENSTKLLIKN